MSVVVNGNFKVFNKDILKPSQAVELISGGVLVHGIIKKVSLEVIEIFIYNDIDDRTMTLPIKIEQIKTSDKNGAELRLLS